MTPREARAAPCATGFAFLPVSSSPRLPVFRPTMPDLLSHRPEARKEQARATMREVADHLVRLAARTDLDDHDFECLLSLELMLLTNGREQWRKAMKEKPQLLNRLQQHRRRIADTDEPEAEAA